MGYTLAFCDDDAQVRGALTDVLARACRACGLDAQIEAFPSAEALTQTMQMRVFDAFVLDIDLPGEDGVALAARIRQADAAASIIFLSGREERVFESLRVQPLRFVRKAHLQEEIVEAMEALRQRLTAGQTERLTVCTPEGIASVPVQQILYVESFGKRQSIHTARGDELQTRQTFHALSDALLPHGFVQVHRCYLVACRYIFSIESNRLILDNGCEIPISRYRLAACKEAFRRYIGDAASYGRV